MGFLFFGKKRSQKDNSLEHINHISENLKNSFVRIKSDIKVVRDWLSFFKTKDEEYNTRFKDIESRLEELGEVISYLSESEKVQQSTPQNNQNTKKEQQYYDYDASTPKRTPLDDLTETQQAIFLRLVAFQRESGQEWTPLKSLAQDIYPGKSYDKIRSTVSEYVGIMVDVGILKKTRKGKQTYITITEKGKEYFNKKRTTNKTTPKPKQP
jgi:hypothetical protein